MLQGVFTGIDRIFGLLEVDSFIKYCQDKGLNIKGLMCIPPEGEDPVPYFKSMQDLTKKYVFPIPQVEIDLSKLEQNER